MTSEWGIVDAKAGEGTPASSFVSAVAASVIGCRESLLVLSLGLFKFPVGECSFAELNVFLEMLEEALLVDGFSEVVDLAFSQAHRLAADDTRDGGEALFHGDLVRITDAIGRRYRHCTSGASAFFRRNRVASRFGALWRNSTSRVNSTLPGERLRSVMCLTGPRVSVSS